MFKVICHYNIDNLCVYYDERGFTSIVNYFHIFLGLLFIRAHSKKGQKPKAKEQPQQPLTTASRVCQTTWPATVIRSEQE